MLLKIFKTKTRSLKSVKLKASRSLKARKFESTFALKFDLVYFSAMILIISQTTLLAARSDFTGRYS